MKRALIVCGVVLGVFAVGFAALFLGFFAVTRGERLDPARLAIRENPVTLTAATGEELPSGQREFVSIQRLPAHLPHAFVAVEDKRFYEHSGFDVRRIGKALLKNLASFSFREGASTISQQLIKNTHLTSEKTVSRKLKEFRLTAMLEKRYTKEQILELYINSIYFGHSAYGIRDAAMFYFGKKAEELVPAESALLAALVKSPNRYSPFKDAAACQRRRDFVLKLMAEQGYLTEEEYNTALAVPLPASPIPLRRGNFYDALVLEELEEVLPGAQTGAYGKLRVETAFEPALQKTLDALPADSDLIALVRSNRTDLLRAIRTTTGLPKRLPASTIKPLLVYGPAVEENLISPATPILDERTDFGGYCPDDAGGASGQYLSARLALARSVNIPAVRILNALGVDRGAEYLHKMGLETGPEDRSLALALGGMREGFDLRALADGYSVLAKGGLYAPSRCIVRIYDGSGRVLYTHPTQGTRVFSEETSFLVTDMLRTAATEGTAKKLRSLPYPVAAKTGTHEGKAGNLDAYTIAYTPDDVVAVWMGNADNSPVDATGGGLPANAVKEIFGALYETAQPADFSVPAGIVRAAYDKEAYEKEHLLLLADPAAPLLIDPSEYFKQSDLPCRQSARFSHPTIQKPSICVQNGSVNIVLCQTEYYDYEVNREHNGQISTIYRGPYRNTICDSSVSPGESYRYTVIPYYQKNKGQAVELPLVKISSAPSSLENWWE